MHIGTIIDVKIINSAIEGQSTVGYIANFKYWYPKLEEFKPKYFMKEGMKQVIDSMYRKKQVPDDSEKNYWEDQIINDHKNGKVLKKIKKGLSFKIKKILNKIKKSN